MTNGSSISCGLLAAVLLAGSISAACNTGPGQGAQPGGAAGATTKPSVAPAAGDPVWHYEGAGNPATWGTLSPKFAACGEGQSQSPIDIAATVPANETLLLKMLFQPATLRIAHHEHVADGINNGHTVQINYEGGDTLTIANDSYALVQYHFHDPSEHTVKGKHFPMEMHMVHKSAGGKLAVVAVFIEEGAHNAAFDPIGPACQSRRAWKPTTLRSRWTSTGCCRRPARLIATTARSRRRRARRACAGSS